MKTLIPSVLVLVVLSACKGTSDSDRTIPTETDATVAAAEPSASGESESPAATPASGTIPTAIHGRWGLVPADCTSTRGDAKGLLTVDDTTLRFYESVGTLAEVKEATATRIRATFDFSGEGTTWRRDETLDLEDDGRTLVRREYGEEATPGPFRYARCA